MADYCPVTSEELSALVDGELPAAQRRALAQHIATCDRCSQQVGRVYALKISLGRADRTPEALPAHFWARLHRCLDEVDAVAGQVISIGPRPAPARRLATLAAAGALLIVVAFGVSNLLLPRGTAWSYLADAHRLIATQLMPGPLRLGQLAGASPAPGAVAWRPAHAQTIRTGPCNGRQVVYSAPGAVVSYFRLPCDGLETGALTPVDSQGRRFYVDKTAELSLVAWREGSGWGALVGNLTPDKLLLLAGLYVGAPQPPGAGL